MKKKLPITKNDEYCIDAFAKGISFALNFKEQAERFMNKKYDY